MVEVVRVEKSHSGDDGGDNVRMMVEVWIRVMVRAVALVGMTVVMMMAGIVVRMLGGDGAVRIWG